MLGCIVFQHAQLGGLVFMNTAKNEIAIDDKNRKGEIEHHGVRAPAGARISHKSATIKQQIFLDGTTVVIADAEVTFAIVDIHSGKAVALEGETKEILQKF